MNARIVSEQEKDKKELSDLIDTLGAIDGQGNTEEFQQIKEQMMNSGMSADDLANLLISGATDSLLQRPQISVPIQLLTETAKIPTYAHPDDACADICSDEEYTYKPGETHLLSTGIAVAVPQDYAIYIYPRSSLGAKSPMRLANSVGIIDSGYRGEIKLPLWNCSDKEFTLLPGDRVCQMEVKMVPQIDFIPVENVSDIGEDRGGGFGSTGV